MEPIFPANLPAWMPEAMKWQQEYMDQVNATLDWIRLRPVKKESEDDD